MSWMSKCAIMADCVSLRFLLALTLYYNDLTSVFINSKELREGGKILVEKLKKFKPLIAVFNGKCKHSSTTDPKI